LPVLAFGGFRPAPVLKPLEHYLMMLARRGHMADGRTNTEGLRFCSKNRATYASSRASNTAPNRAQYCAWIQPMFSSSSSSACARCVGVNRTETQKSERVCVRSLSFVLSLRRSLLLSLCSLSHHFDLDLDLPWSLPLSSFPPPSSLSRAPSLPPSRLLPFLCFFPSDGRGVASLG